MEKTNINHTSNFFFKHLDACGNHGIAWFGDPDPLSSSLTRLVEFKNIT